LLPEFFSSKPAGRAADTQPAETPDSPPDDTDTTPRSPRDGDLALASQRGADAAKNAAKVKLVRVQGIDLEDEMDIPFLWLANNLKNPECYLHVCVYVGAGV
jgi:autophagy-related protein 5